MNNEWKSTFETLKVWKEGRNQRIEISQLVKEFPKCEEYKLKDQMIRASRSIPSNLAEGYGRYHFHKNIRFCRQARGSLYELLEHLYIAQDEFYITGERFTYFKNKIIDLLKIINGYISYLKNQKNSSSATKNNPSESNHPLHSTNNNHSPYSTDSTYSTHSTNNKGESNGL